MKKNQAPVSSENRSDEIRLEETRSSGRLPDGSLRFIVVLPPEVADLFEAEMKNQDRKKLPMARYIITQWLRQRAKDADYAAFSARREKAVNASGPEFGYERSPQHDATYRKSTG